MPVGWVCKRLRFMTRAAKGLFAAGLFFSEGAVNAAPPVAVCVLFRRTMVTVLCSWGTASLMVVLARCLFTETGRAKAEGAKGSSAEEHSASDLSVPSAGVVVSGVMYGALRFSPLRSSMPAPHSKFGGGSGHGGLGTLP